MPWPVAAADGGGPASSSSRVTSQGPDVAPDGPGLGPSGARHRSCLNFNYGDLVDIEYDD